ncbi:MAG TPA: ribosomal protein L7/L12 [Flavobacterium sp.]|uniref:ribosomal protein L7/L12 n=2 Tax=Flavobacterium TaxID=237 RepID=UPI0025C36B2C|nr:MULTISPECIES: ribosomal protein L7/L12 [unclassified Flavobacterium]HRE77992.1 ribosomal protein L7/L12 [Flavobacterium sp.]
MDYIRYFQTYSDYFWILNHYQDDFGETQYIFEIPNGTTIAYSNYVIEVLQLLSDESIPPLGSLLLAIAATNPDSHTSIALIEEFTRSTKIVNSFPNANLSNVTRTLDFLKLLAELPSEYKTGDKRILLFKTIFHDCHNRLTREKAKAILTDFEKNAFDFYTDLNPISFNQANFVKDFRTIALLKHQFPLASSLLKALTGLPEEEISAQFEEDLLELKQPPKKPIEFVEDLIENPKTFQVGRLIKQIWSGLNIPLHHNVPSHQPMGGVSDLTNKGDFDRLLLSEFANDEDVFMSRIANNEALYILREIPPQDTRKTRILLIDCSLRNWGNPKIISFATAIAIAKHPKTDIACEAFALGDTYKKVDFEKVSQVIEGLNQLNGKLDCSKGLQAYFDEQYSNASALEIMILTTPDTLNSIDFLRVINENYDRINFLITTESNGVIDFHKIKNKARKHVQKIKLNLLDLWVKNKVNGKIAFSQNLNEEVPIYYPLERDYHAIALYKNEFYIFLNGNLLTFVDGFEKGFRMVTQGIPFRSKKFMLKENTKGELLLIILEKEDGMLYSCNLDSKEILSKPFSKAISFVGLNFFSTQNTIYLTNSEDYWEIDEHLEFKNNTFKKIISHGQDTYVSTLYDFINSYKQNYNRYNVLRRINTCQLNLRTGLLEINNYIFFNTSFINAQNLNGDSFDRFESKSNLILKRVGPDRISVIRLLMTRLNYSFHESQSILDKDLPVIQEDIMHHEAESLKYELEKIGAICYIEIIYFFSEDGSTIKNNNGILELESSSTIPKIYIPFIVNKPSAMSTDSEFAGNEYFLPENSTLTIISVDEFHQKYFKPFVNHIKEYVS